MPLVVSQLQSDLQQIFDRQLESVSEIARRIAQAYQSYAVGAQSPTGAPATLKGTESKVAEGAVLQIMKGRFSPPQAAQTIANAVNAFWLIPPVTFGPGVVTAVVPQSGIGTLLSARLSDTSQAGKTLGAALDAMTRTVFVTSPPPAPSGTVI